MADPTSLNVKRTPDSAFADLPGFGFEANYVSDLTGFAGLRAHYVNQGPQVKPDAENPDSVILCLHGQPTWSYLYRKMIPVFTQAGHRVIAPDLFGFGRSDKPVDENFYTFSQHRDMLIAFINQVILLSNPGARIMLVVQDWGGILGLTLPMEFPENIDRLLVMNTSLGSGDVPLGQGFLDWRDYSNSRPDMDIAALMRRGEPRMSMEESRAYAAPFPDVSFKTGVQRFPNLVPDHPDADGAEISRAARDWLQSRWAGHSFMAIGMRDPVLGPAVMHNLRKLIKGCPDPFEVEEGGHFVQEHGQIIARKALEVLC